MVLLLHDLLADALERVFHLPRNGRRRQSAAEPMRQR